MHQSIPIYNNENKGEQDNNNNNNNIKEQQIIIKYKKCIYFYKNKKTQVFKRWDDKKMIVLNCNVHNDRANYVS